MIKVTIKSQNNLFKKISIAGHAASEIEQNDKVCAAVSAICFGTINYLIEKKDKKLNFLKEKNLITFTNNSDIENKLLFIYCQLKTVYNQWEDFFSWNEK